MNSFLSEQELKSLEFKRIGNGVKISRKASFYNISQIEIGDNSRIDDFTVLSGKIRIGRNVHISAYAGIFAGNAGVLIDDFCAISIRTCILAVSDDFSGFAMTNPTIPDECRMVTEKEVIIHKHVLIGAGVIVLPGIVIGEGCAFGAMSLISKNTIPWSIYVGVPARRIKDRSRHLLEYESKILNE